MARATYWCFRYHLGSIAFGSFVIAVCQMIRAFFEYYRQKMGMLNKELPVVKVILCATGYLLWCLENCIKYVTKNAYIQVALTNESFCKSAWNAFCLMLKNVDKFGFGNSIGFIFMFFGCLCICAICSGGSYLFLTNYGGLTITSPIPPCIVIGIMSIAISYLFLSIFSFSSDAILQSFLLDEELRFQGNARPEYMQEFAASMKERANGNGCCNFSCW
jgi:choline transporter-like protein 2/4/5